MKKYTYQALWDELKCLAYKQIQSEVMLKRVTEPEALNLIKKYNRDIILNPEDEKKLKGKLWAKIRHYNLSGGDVCDIFSVDFHYSGGILMACDLNYKIAHLKAYKNKVSEIMKDQEIQDYILENYRQGKFKMLNDNYEDFNPWFLPPIYKHVSIKGCKEVLRLYIDYLNLKSGYKPLTPAERKAKQRGESKKKKQKRVAIEMLKQGAPIKSVIEESGLKKSAIYNLRKEINSKKCHEKFPIK